MFAKIIILLYNLLSMKKLNEFARFVRSGYLYLKNSS